jgi:hypothetical protein
MFRVLFVFRIYSCFLLAGDPHKKTSRKQRACTSRCARVTQFQVQLTRATLNPFRPLLFFLTKKSYRYLFVVMLAEQLAGAGFGALIFQYTRQAFNADTSLLSLALATFNLATATMPGVLLPVCNYGTC